MRFAAFLFALSILAAVCQALPFDQDHLVARGPTAQGKKAVTAATNLVKSGASTVTSNVVDQAKTAVKGAAGTVQLLQENKDNIRTAANVADKGAFLAGPNAPAVKAGAKGAKIAATVLGALPQVKVYRRVSQLDEED